MDPILLAAVIAFAGSALSTTGLFQRNHLVKAALNLGCLTCLVTSVVIFVFNK